MLSMLGKVHANKDDKAIWIIKKALRQSKVKGKLLSYARKPHFTVSPNPRENHLKCTLIHYAIYPTYLLGESK